MGEYLGLDASNYTTSAAVYDSLSGKIRQNKKLLPVKPGEKGLRQSDALFHHIKQLPEVSEALLENSDICAAAASVRPRNVEGSYMPCFLAGETSARLISASRHIPFYPTSHQVGHILAALYSADRLSLLYSHKPFIAFHLSGGTTDCLLCEYDPGEVIKCREIGTSLDLKAGQAVDRVGVMLGLSFPCGKELEKLACRSSRKFKIAPSIRGGNCSLSGLENICKKMFDDGEEPCDIALYCLKYIEAALIKMTEAAISNYGELPLIYAGGVMSNLIIRKGIENRFSAHFADPEFSSDNAAGIALYAYIKEELK